MVNLFRAMNKMPLRAPCGPVCSAISFTNNFRHRHWVPSFNSMPNATPFIHCDRIISKGYEMCVIHFASPETTHNRSSPAIWCSSNLCCSLHTMSPYRSRSSGYCRGQTHTHAHISMVPRSITAQWQSSFYDVLLLSYAPLIKMLRAFIDSIRCIATTHNR